MPFDPVSWGLGWVLTRATSRIWLSKPSLASGLRAEVALWAKALPTDAWVYPDALFPSILSDEEAVDRPLLLQLRQVLLANEIPRVEVWDSAFREQWRARRDLGVNAQPFFLLSEQAVIPHLHDLAKRVFNVCCEQDPLFRPTLVSNQREILGLQENIADQLAELTKRLALDPVPAGLNDWLPLETYAVVFPPSVQVDKAWQFICRLLVLSLHETFALSRYVQFISAVQNRPIEFEGKQLTSFEILSQQRDFVAAARRRTKAVLDSGDRTVAQETDEAVEALRNDGWRFEFKIPLGTFYRPVLFAYDARTKIIAIKDRSSADEARELNASDILTTSDQIELMCSLSRLKILDVVNFDETRSNPAAFRFLVSLAAEKGFDFGRIRVHRRDYEKWDYLLSAL